jgi:CheY-like chemotaxis protein
MTLPTKPRILVVEDDPGTQKLLEALLLRVDFAVDVVDSGDQALLLLRLASYSAVIMDLMIRGVGGATVLEHLAVEAPDILKHTLVLTAWPQHFAEMGRSFPQVAFMRKPFELLELRDTVLRMARTSVVESDLVRDLARRGAVAGAKGGITVLRRGANELDVVSSFGYPPGYAESFSPFDLTSELPICICVRHARPLYLASLNSARADFPTMASVWEETGTRALASVPLSPGGRTIGAIGWSFHEPQPFHESQQRLLERIAGDAALIYGEQSGIRTGT